MHLRPMLSVRDLSRSIRFYRSALGFELVESLGGTEEPFESLLELLRERSATLVEMAEKARFAAVDRVEPDEKASKKFLKAASLPILESLSAGLSALSDTGGGPDACWDEAGIERVFESVRAAHDDIGMVLRGRGHAATIAIAPIGNNHVTRVPRIAVQPLTPMTVCHPHLTHPTRDEIVGQMQPPIIAMLVDNSVPPISSARVVASKL